MKDVIILKVEIWCEGYSAGFLGQGHVLMLPAISLNIYYGDSVCKLPVCKGTTHLCVAQVFLATRTFDSFMAQFANKKFSIFGLSKIFNRSVDNQIRKCTRMFSNEPRDYHDHF